MAYVQINLVEDLEGRRAKAEEYFCWRRPASEVANYFVFVGCQQPTRFPSLMTTSSMSNRHHQTNVAELRSTLKCLFDFPSRPSHCLATLATKTSTTFSLSSMRRSSCYSNPLANTHSLLGPNTVDAILGPSRRESFTANSRSPCRMMKKTRNDTLPYCGLRRDRLHALFGHPNPKAQIALAVLEME